MKIRLNSFRDENETFIKMLKAIEKTGVIKIISESKPYVNRGNTICERVYLDIAINPRFGGNIEPILNEIEVHNGKYHTNWRS